MLQSMGWSADQFHLHSEDDVEAEPVGGFAIHPGFMTDSTDKYPQGYMPIYRELADELGPAANVCEVGIWYGKSLEIWQEWFPDGIVAGVDLWDNAQWPTGSYMIRADQSDPQVAALLLEASPRWDLIIDDCCHEAGPTMATMQNLWPLVRPGGYYVIEDWFYGWHDSQHLLPYNMVSMAKDFLEQLRPDSEVEEIRYRYGLIVIKKWALDASRPAGLVKLED
jgi:hypothetical protein